MLARPTAEQLAWHDLEIGMFIHFGIETYEDVETDDFSFPISRFNPEARDTENWVDVAESMGAKYIILVAKHIGGFCLWQTETTDYSIGNTPWRDGKGDLLADLADSCRRRGLRLGVYLSPSDLYHDAPMGLGGKTSDPDKQDAYERVFRQQLVEVLSRYGEMMEVWFDGSCIFDVGDILEAHAPNAMVFQSPHCTIRWVGNEAGYVPADMPWNSVSVEAARSGVATSDDADPDGGAWLPNEVDTPIRDHYWFWSSTNGDSLKSLDHLMDIYYSSVGRSAVLLLNITPGPDGLMPEADARRAAEFGAEIRRRFGAPLAETTGEGGVVKLTLDRETTVDHVVTMERIAKGERVREYVVEGKVAGEWVTLCEGRGIGHKKIDRFDPVSASAVRFRSLDPAAKPLIRSLALYHVGASASAVVATPTHERQMVGTARPGETTEVDLSACIDLPGQWEVALEADGDVRVRPPMLVIAGVKAPDFIRRMDAPDSYNINITATPTLEPGSIVLELKVKAAGEPVRVFVRRRGG